MEIFIGSDLYRNLKHRRKIPYYFMCIEILTQKFEREDIARTRTHRVGCLKQDKITQTKRQPFIEQLCYKNDNK